MVVSVSEPRYCIGCNEPFISHKNAKRCKPNCGRTSDESHAANKARIALHEVEFIGVDGEGINGWGYEDVWDDESNDIVRKRCKTHDYVLLSVGDQSLHLDGKRLTHHEIFPFLWEQYLAHPNAAFVGFFLGYDFTHWFRELPELRAWKLLSKDGIASRMRRQREGEAPTIPRPWPVRVGNWEFDVLANKRFMLRPFVKKEDQETKIVTHKDGTQTAEPIPRPWMYVCDSGSFFQSSFLTAIEPKQWQTPVLSPDEYATIKKGKEERADAAFDTDMIRYNILENEVLARVMTTVNEGLVGDNIRLARQQWFGPGQAAQKWLGLVGCPPGEEIREVVPQWARDAGRESYYGGWFEIFAHGIIDGNSYGYDINSAYPYGISTLPCLLHGEWTRGTGRMSPLARNAIRLVNVTVRGNSQRIGCMPFRRPDGSIARFQHQSGWYWWDEIKAAIAAGAIIASSVKVAEWIQYDPCACKPPLQDIRELYQGRLDVGKNSPAGKGKKLIYNSAYGKLAQSVGAPKFTNSIYASRITALCRIQILNAIATHPTKSDSLVMVATDSVVFKERHPFLNIHETELGAWDETKHTNLTLFMPGVYWDDTTRQRIADNESPKLKSRGIPAIDLAKWVARIDAEWTDLLTRADNWRWPTVKLPVKFQMVTAKQAVVRNDWITCGKVTDDGFREISADPSSKRQDLPWKNQKYGYIETCIYPHDVHSDGSPNLRTTAYDKAFGELDDRENGADVPITPDGDIIGIMQQALIP